jgi:glycosyltransferase involved in cell wall biosynthesis
MNGRRDILTVSVLIPAYNCEATISRAIQSVLQQTFQDFELIIVDDGSQDATLELVKSIIDPRIKVVLHPKNLGEAEARNTAVKSAAGRFVAFLDSDDEWFPEKLSRQMEVLSSEQEGITANISGYFLYDEFDIRRKEIPSQPVSWYKHLLMGCGLGPGTTLLVSREAFEKIGYYDPSLPRYTDWDWLMRYTKFYPLSVTREPLAIIYRGSQPRAEVVEMAARRFLDKHLQEFQQFGYYGKRAVGKRYLEVAIYYYQEGNRRAGWAWFRKAISHSAFQRPGMYLRILDIMIGTSIVPAVLRLRGRLFKAKG